MYMMGIYIIIIYNYMFSAASIVQEHLGFRASIWDNVPILKFYNTMQFQCKGIVLEG